MYTVSPTQSDIFTVLRAFLLTVLPTGMEVIQGQMNRVGEPQGVDFAVMWVINRDRLATNIDSVQDTRFTGSIAGTTLTITDISFGTLADGNPIFGVDVIDGTLILTQLTGVTGGIGTYQLSVAQTVVSSVLSASTQELLQKTKIMIQIDVHGPASADNAQVITTAFRDDFATTFFTDAGFDGAPMYADDPKQIPFINAEEQYETRYVIDVVLQANQKVKVPQQFADSVIVGIIDVDVVYPPV